MRFRLTTRTVIELSDQEAMETFGTTDPPTVAEAIGTATDARLARDIRAMPYFKAASASAEPIYE